MIIVEGMDNSGKTTLVQRLSIDLKLLVLNNRRRPKEAQDIKDYVDMITPLCRTFPTILDRFAPISEPIYGPICRNSHLLTEGEVHDLLQHISIYNKPLVIYCRPDKDRILKFDDSIEQMDGVIKHAPALVEAYDRSMKNLQMNWFTVFYYDWEFDSYDSLVHQINKKLEDYL